MDTSAKFLQFLEKKDQFIVLLSGYVLVGAIGLIDFASGYEISISVLYVLPVSLITWRVGWRHGIAASIGSAVVWFSADIAMREPYSHSMIPAWNAAIRLTFFVIITVLLTALRRAMQRETELAQTDHLTGAVNRRFFSYLAHSEMDRCQRYRHPFTIVYFDIDNFKYINDNFGHLVGDQVLRSVVNVLRKHIRSTDQIARLGGDEFALLLPETDQSTARIVLQVIRSVLSEEMLSSNWPVTFSVGVLTCTDAPSSTDSLVAMADKLMYEVKNSGKNSILYDTYPAPNSNQACLDLN